ncbi:MAG: helix-turn-helix domain-containing protein [Nitrosomonas sp.]|nr:helix-turn-helix domain-containing protein [Nitrosomonas sp.]
MGDRGRFFPETPAAVFLRGYIRNYANLLQLDDVPLLMEAVPRARPVDTVFASKRNAQRFKAIEPVYDLAAAVAAGGCILR